MMALIFLFSSLPGNDFPKYEGIWDFIIKKSGHLLEYGVLTAAVWRGFTNSNEDRGNATDEGAERIGAILRSLALTVGYAVTDEFHQMFTPGRTSSPIDVGIDLVGACLGLALWFALGAIRQTRSRSPRSRPTRPPT